MKIAVIDVGSNSVRLGMIADGKTLYKSIKTTRLGEGLSFSGAIKREAMERSAQAVAFFVERAKSEGAEKTYVFATAAVRSAINGGDFVSLTRGLCGVEIDVISGEKEAQIGMLGALGLSDGGMIDLGGASTEVTVRRRGETAYAKSVNIGAVRLYDLAGRDYATLEKVIADKLPEYGVFSAKLDDMWGVSGTATTLAALKHGLKEYAPQVVQGTPLTVSEIENCALTLLNTPVEKICELCAVDARRADIIGGGALLLARLMQKFEIEKIRVSDRDNLEGYLMLKEGAL